jgi:predicted HicB family RNase H-like nuclease
MAEKKSRRKAPAKTAEAKSPPRLKRIYFDVSPEAHTKLKMKALQEGMTLKAYMEQLINSL